MHYILILKLIWEIIEGQYAFITIKDGTIWVKNKKKY